MRREPDNQDVIDDSGSYDVRDLRGRRIDPELVELIARTVQKMRPEISYTERSDDRLLKWLLGLVSALILASIVGAVGVYGVVEALRATVQAANQRLDRIENRLDGRSGITRGADDSHAR